MEESHAALTATDASFVADVEQFPGVVLVDFWAPWCGPCLQAGPEVEKTAKAFADNPMVKVMKVNVDDNTEVSGKYGIMSIPSFKVFRDGTLVHSVTGVRMQPELSMMIEQQLKELAPTSTEEMPAAAEAAEADETMPAAE